MANGDAASSSASGEIQHDPDEAARAEAAARDTAVRADAPPSPLTSRGDAAKSMRCFGRPLVADEDDGAVVAADEVVVDGGAPHRGVVGLYNLGAGRMYGWLL